MGGLIIVVCSQRRNISKQVGCFVFVWLPHSWEVRQVRALAQECVWSTLAVLVSPMEPDFSGTCWSSAPPRSESGPNVWFDYHYQLHHH